MIKSSVEKLAGDIGFEIGTSDDITQANLLNGFCKGIANSMEKPDMQLCYIADKLSGKSGDVLKQLVEFIKLKEANV